MGLEPALESDPPSEIGFVKGTFLTTPGEVHFVFLGDSLPAYARASLRLARAHSGLKPVLIGNREIFRGLRLGDVERVSVEDFYDPQQFDEVSNNITSSRSFQGGFWLKTLERFFVLSQYGSAAHLSSIFHAELDQLLFRADILAEGLSTLSDRGIFLPFHSKEAAVASVLYCNDLGSLKMMLDYAASSEPFPNEMALIARWAKEPDSSIISLPTLASVMRPGQIDFEPHTRQLSINDTAGVVDAAQVGQWLAGIDPRNVHISETPKNKFVDKPEPHLLSKEDFQRCRFSFDEETGHLEVQPGEGVSVRMFNLHLHSKAHPWLARRKSGLTRLLELSRDSEPVKIPGSRLMQLRSWGRRSFGAQTRRFLRAIKAMS